MIPLVTALDALVALLRTALLAGGMAVAVLAAASWAVRTRRLNPFGAPARLVRARVDPLFVPVERRLLRYGGRPTTAPWWALAAVVVGGIVVLSVLGFLRDQLLVAAQASQMGPRGFYVLAVTWTIAVLRLALLVRVISSWFQMGPYSPWVRWAFTLTEWLLAPLRRVIPTVGMIDITPIVAYFALSLVERVLVGLAT
jgi:YggT family protein